ncbi:EspA/EspE family type VII secretion system effector [Mycolicibacterium sp. jd]|uniref:EspA/EspE family type VII secretion system effector n=1 Tax=Mycolicibacterium sp. jd TaxID=2973594 RepID=UPI00351AFFFC
MPSRFVDNPILELADSPPIELAQRVISGMRLTTGSGDPVDGEEFRNAAKLMQEALELLIDAAPHGDHWNGDASEKYADANTRNRRATSGVQVADWNIADYIEAEAEQVVRTRKTLDDINEYLFQFALSTAWMNGIPGGRAAKLALDAAAASSAVLSAERALLALVSDSVGRGGKIRDQFSLYSAAANQKQTLDDPACDGPFVPAKVDRSDAGRPDRFNNPRYTVPKPVEPPHHGPPATPYVAGGSTVPVPTIPSTPVTTPSAAGSTPATPVPAPSTARTAHPGSAPSSWAQTNPTPPPAPPTLRPPGAPDTRTGAPPGQNSGNGGAAPLTVTERPSSDDRNQANQT